MNNFLPDNDSDLVNFLQQHRPLPPKARPGLESQLMEAVTRQPQTSVKNVSSWFWAVPGAIAMGLIVTWNSQRFLPPTPKLAQDTIDLELFVVNSWQATIEDSSFSTTPEAEIYQLLSTVESSQVISATTAK